jgi:predicted O-methyltransferase YrrM
MKEEIPYFLKNPGRIPKWVLGETKKLIRANLSSEYDSYKVNNDTEIEDFINDLDRSLKDKFQITDGLTGKIGKKDAISLYRFIREEKPERVVETGVCNGYSTAVILRALEDNGSGKLYSIDLPDYGEDDDRIWDEKGGWVIPSSEEPGWLVNDSLRDRWELILGNSNEKLPELLSNLSEIDVFIHDSEHSYQTMMLEYCVAWRYLKKDGKLVSDDISSNKAFEQFSSAQDADKKLLGNLGLIEKKETRS